MKDMTKNVVNMLKISEHQFDQLYIRFLLVWHVKADTGYGSNNFLPGFFPVPQKNEYIAVRTVAGEGVIELANGAAVFTLTENTFICVKRLDITYVFCSKDHWDFEWYLFETTDASHITLNQIRTVCRTETERRISEDCFRSIGSDVYHQALYSQHLFQSLLALWHTDGIENALLRETNITSILNFTIDKLSLKVTVLEIANMLNMSEQKLRRMFITYVGMPPKRYMEERRLANALELLEATTLTVKEIAEKCGFFDSCHFHRCFKKKIGYSPKMARGNAPTSKDI